MKIAFETLSRRTFGLLMSGLLVTALCAAGSLATPAAAQERSTPEEAEAMVERAIAHYDEVGEEQAFADFNDSNGEFVDNDLYVIVCTMDGIYKTHAHNPALIDNDILWDIQDVNGNFPVRRIVESAQENPEGGWVDYVWVNPVNEALETKRLYVQEHAGYAFAVGYYEAN